MQPIRNFDHSHINFSRTNSQEERRRADSRSSGDTQGRIERAWRTDRERCNEQQTGFERRKELRNEINKLAKENNLEEVEKKLEKVKKFSHNFLKLMYKDAIISFNNIGEIQKAEKLLNDMHIKKGDDLNHIYSSFLYLSSKAKDEKRSFYYYKKLKKENSINENSYNCMLYFSNEYKDLQKAKEILIEMESRKITISIELSKLTEYLIEKKDVDSLEFLLKKTPYDKYVISSLLFLFEGEDFDCYFEEKTEGKNKWFKRVVLSCYLKICVGHCGDRGENQKFFRLMELLKNKKIELFDLDYFYFLICFIKKEVEKENIYKEIKRKEFKVKEKIYNVIFCGLAKDYYLNGLGDDYLIELKKVTNKMKDEKIEFLEKYLPFIKKQYQETSNQKEQIELLSNFTQDGRLIPWEEMKKKVEQAPDLEAVFKCPLQKKLIQTSSSTNPEERSLNPAQELLEAQQSRLEGTVSHCENEPVSSRENLAVEEPVSEPACQPESLMASQPAIDSLPLLTNSQTAIEKEMVNATASTQILAPESSLEYTSEQKRTFKSLIELTRKFISVFKDYRYGYFSVDLKNRQFASLRNELVKMLRESKTGKEEVRLFGFYDSLATPNNSFFYGTPLRESKAPIFPENKPNQFVEFYLRQWHCFLQGNLNHYEGDYVFEQKVIGYYKVDRQTPFLFQIEPLSENQKPSADAFTVFDEAAPKINKRLHSASTSFCEPNKKAYKTDQTFDLAQLQALRSKEKENVLWQNTPGVVNLLLRERSHLFNEKKAERTKKGQTAAATVLKESYYRHIRTTSQEIEAWSEKMISHLPSLGSSKTKERLQRLFSSANSDEIEILARDHEKSPYLFLQTSQLFERSFFRFLIWQTMKGKKVLIALSKTDYANYKTSASKLLASTQQEISRDLPPRSTSAQKKDKSALCHKNLSFSFLGSKTPVEASLLAKNAIMVMNEKGLRTFLDSYTPQNDDQPFLIVMPFHKETPNTIQQSSLWQQPSVQWLFCSKFSSAKEQSRYLEMVGLEPVLGRMDQIASELVSGSFLQKELPKKQKELLECAIIINRSIRLLTLNKPEIKVPLKEKIVIDEKSNDLESTLKKIKLKGPFLYLVNSFQAEDKIQDYSSRLFNILKKQNPDLICIDGKTAEKGRIISKDNKAVIATTLTLPSNYRPPYIYLDPGVKNSQLPSWLFSGAKKIYQLLLGNAPQHSFECRNLLSMHFSESYEELVDSIKAKIASLRKKPLQWNLPEQEVNRLKDDMYKDCFRAPGSSASPQQDARRQQQEMTAAERPASLKRVKPSASQQVLGRDLISEKRRKETAAKSARSSAPRSTQNASMQWYRDHLSIYFDYREEPGDGSCLFYCLARHWQPEAAEQDLTKTMLEMRKALAFYMRQNFSQFSRFYGTEGVSNAIKDAETGEWGDEIHIEAFCLMTGCTAYLYDSRDKGVLYDHSQDFVFPKSDVKIKNRDGRQTDPIYLFYKDGNHWDWLSPKNGPKHHSDSSLEA